MCLLSRMRLHTLRRLMLQGTLACCSLDNYSPGKNNPDIPAPSHETMSWHAMMASNTTNFTNTYKNKKNSKLIASRCHGGQQGKKTRQIDRWVNSQQGKTTVPAESRTSVRVASRHLAAAASEGAEPQIPQCGGFDSSSMVSCRRKANREHVLPTHSQAV